MSDGPQARARIAAMLAEMPAHVTAIRIERFLGHTVGSVVDVVLDEAALIASDAPADPSHDARKPGRRLFFYTHDRQCIASIEVHPIAVDFEEGLLPRLFHAIEGRAVMVELWGRDGASTKLDAWHGEYLFASIAARRQLQAAHDRQAAFSIQPQLLHELQTILASASARAEAQGERLVLVRERVRKAQPWVWLVMIPFLCLLPVFILTGSATAVFADIRGRAGVNEAQLLRYEIDPNTRTVVASYRKNGTITWSETLAVDALFAFGLAPECAKLDERTTRPVLRAFLRDRTVKLELGENESNEASWVAARAWKAALERAIREM